MVCGVAWGGSVESYLCSYGTEMVGSLLFKEGLAGRSSYTGFPIAF